MTLFINKNKYKNKKVFLYDTKKADSKKEEKRRIALEFMEKSNIISNLECQKKFILQESFEYNNKKERPITYIADFFYYDNEKHKYVVEDVKGFKTQVYRIKKKLFLYKYKDYEFKEI